MKKLDNKMLTLIGAVVIVVAAGIIFSYPNAIPSYGSSDSEQMTDSADEASTSESMEETHEDAMMEGEAMEESGEAMIEESETEVMVESEAMEEGPQEFTIEMSDDGFSVESLTVKAGDTVTWVATDNSLRWPATDVHPSHTLYPGSSISDCGKEDVEIFDSCGKLRKGESFSFTFNEVGEWAYHDHLDTRATGTIIVE